VCPIWVCWLKRSEIFVSYWVKVLTPALDLAPWAEVTVIISVFGTWLGRFPPVITTGVG